ncbi:glycosyltransferase family 2 protein [Arthrobacter sp. U41]|uniref:glycosyltransferase family 2 protein n=1 Tax=Arthrobacter sp. U41 TaxID=1849032 RepID=UPI00119DB884|nr:glycosyltransferase family 2 protein [Arthrobacter sp. U41]
MISRLPGIVEYRGLPLVLGHNIHVVEGYVLPHSIVTMSRGDATRLREWMDYHSLLGFDDFHIILDNPNDESEQLLRSWGGPAKITVDIRPAHDAYYDGLTPAERYKEVLAWRERNAESLKDWDAPIIDSLSLRQALYFPAVLNKYALRKVGWLALIDVDEFIVLPSGQKISDLTEDASAPRIHFLNFNFDTTGHDPARPVLEQHRMRWSREDLVAHGKGWANRVKTIAQYDSLLPFKSVHAISAGYGEILSPEVGRLHHYKAAVHVLKDVPYSVDDASAAELLRVTSAHGTDDV